MSALWTYNISLVLFVANINTLYCVIFLMAISIEEMFKEECCKQCRDIKFKGNMTKWPVHKQTHRTTQKHTEHQDATDIQKTRFFCVFQILTIQRSQKRLLFT